MKALGAIAGLLDIVPGWIWALLWGSALAGCALATWQLSGEREANANARAEHAEQIARMAGASVRAEAEWRRREQALAGRILEETYAADQALELARADAVAARGAGQRLRGQLAALATASCAASTAAGTATTSPAAQQAADLLADVQRRLDDATDDIARFADAASTAGALCERIADRTRETLNTELPHGPEVRE